MDMNRNTTFGLTLIELVVTIAIAGILAGLAVPSFREMIQNNRMASHANEMVSSLNLARSEAVKRGVRVKLKAVGGGATNEWGKGWTVWTDNNNNDSQDAGEDTLRQVAAFNSDVTLDSSTGSTILSYTPDGVLGSQETMDLCDSKQSGEKGRRLTIAPSGRVSVAELTCG